MLRHQEKLAALARLAGNRPPVVTRVGLLLIESILTKIGWIGLFASGAAVILGIVTGQWGIAVSGLVLYFITSIPRRMAKAVERVRTGQVPADEKKAEKRTPRKAGNPSQAPAPVPVSAFSSPPVRFDPNSEMFKQRPIVQRMGRRP